MLVVPAVLVVSSMLVVSGLMCSGRSLFGS
jgi:hypothetical protein